MKKGKGKISSYSVALNWIQQLYNLLPFIVGALLAGHVLNIAYHHLSSFKLSKISEHNCNIAKDPDCRRASSSENNSTSLPDYDDLEENPKKEPIVIKETWKDPGLLNLEKFEYVMNNETICKSDPKAPNDTRILPVLVHSYRDQSSKREVIRKSWGSIPIYKKWDVRLIFLLGEANLTIDKNDESSNDKLKEEQEKYGDLVMGNFVENSKNLTYKHMMGHKWILNYCSNATFVIKVDGDKFLDIVRWLDWRSKDMDILKEMGKNDKDDEDDYREDGKSPVPDLYCNVFSGGQPVRREESSYYASVEDWPEDFYYDYCSSWAYGITVDLMKKLYSVSGERDFFWIDDVYFGALLHLAKQKFDWDPVINDCFKTHMGKPEKYRQICEENGDVHLDKEKDFGSVLIVEEIKFEEDMMCLWNKTLHDSGIQIKK